MKKKGFTLVEVLVAIIIIMILATYSVLKYTETIYEGENKKARSQMELIAGAYKRYLMEYPEPEDALTGIVTYSDSKCRASKAAGAGVSFDCGKPDLSGSKYNFYLGTPPSSGSPACDASLATMKPKSGAKVGKKFESGYCAFIDRYGRAMDALSAE